MPSDPSTDHIVDAEVVEELQQPAGAEEAVEGMPVPAGAEEAVEGMPVPAGAEEAVEGMPVLSELRTVVTPAPVVLPAVQAAAVAATGFVAGAATLALVKRHSARKLARTRQSRRALEALPIVGSRSFLVDVHLIARDPGGNQ
jgi:hypothetical protein